MTFTKIDKPTEEGEKSECVFCGVPLMAVFTDYGGKFEDYLQWKYQGKSHYKMDGSCKGNNNGSSDPGVVVTQESTVETNTVNTQTNEIESQLAALNLKVESIYSMISEFYAVYEERKNNENL